MVNTAELIARVRQSAVLEDTSKDWTDQLILDEMNDQLTQLYEASVVKSRQGYWRKQSIFTLTPGLATYRMPGRAIAGAIERLQIRGSTAETWSPLDEVDDTQALSYELSDGQAGQTIRFVLRGDSIVMLPAPDKAYQVRCFYYIRPSTLATTTGVVPGVTSMGGIQFWNQSTLTATLYAPIQQYLNGVWNAPIVSAVSISVDVVGNDGWNDVVVPSAVGTLAAGGLSMVMQPNFFPGITYDFSGIVGSNRCAMRQPEVTFIPSLPVDYHRSLADATAIRILTLRGMASKANELMALVSADLGRFGDLIKPRVQTSAKAIVAPQMYGSRRYGARY